MKKFIITEQERKTILKMYGLINESDWKTCKKCIGNYSGLLDKCGFYAIERFEENYGDPNGQSMGDDYFESFDGGYTKFDKIITERLNKYIPNALGSMNSKTKMQIWSFMYNSDSKPNDRFRWLAILYLTANKNISKFDEALTMQIIDKNDLTKWNEAIQLVNNTTDWNYNKLLKMIDGQYGTYNPDKYKSTWSYRPTALDEMYDDCINGIDPKTNKVDNNIETKKQSDNLKNTDKITDNLNNIEKTTFDTSVLVNSPEAKIILDGKKLIRLGRTSVLMPTIQDVLKSTGQLPKDFVTSEKYDKKTYYAIRKFQKEKNLRIDGIIGKKTLGALGIAGSELQIQKQDSDSFVKTNDVVVNKQDSEIESKTKNTTNDSNISSGDNTSNLNFGKKIGDIISQDLKNSSYNMEPW